MTTCGPLVKCLLGIVDQVELLQANPQFAYVRYPDGRETTGSIRHLAPAGESTEGERLDIPDNVPASVDEPHLAPVEVPASVDEPRLAPIEVPVEHYISRSFHMCSIAVKNKLFCTPMYTYVTCGGTIRHRAFIS